MSNIASLRHRVKWFDPGSLDLRDMVLTMVIALSCFGFGLLFKHYAHLFDDTVILSTVLAITIARSQASADSRQRSMALAIIPAMAIAAGEASMLMGSHVALGDAIFVAALTTAVWIRRFGSRFAQVGTMMTLPFIAMLMIPSGLPFFGALHQLWSGAVAAVAVLCVALWQISARRIGFTQLPSGGVQPAPLRRDREKRSTKGISVSTRMALQMAAALSCAFALGHYVFGSHWIWVVLTAYIVCSGNRGRGDVVHKSAMRVIGAACGTAVATGLSGLLPPGDATSIVLIFVVIAFAVWLRPVNYAFWAFSVTAALAFLYGYFGESGAGLLGTRLEAILLGAAIGASATWLLLPVRSRGRPTAARKRSAGLDGGVSQGPGRYAGEAQSAPISDRSRNGFDGRGLPNTAGREYCDWSAPEWPRHPGGASAASMRGRSATACVGRPIVSRCARGSRHRSAHRITRGHNRIYPAGAE